MNAITFSIGLLLKKLISQYNKPISFSHFNVVIKTIGSSLFDKVKFLIY